MRWRRLLAIQLTVAVYSLLRLLGEWTAKNSAKTSVAGNWSPEEKQTSAKDVTLTASHVATAMVLGLLVLPATAPAKAHAATPIE